MNQIHIYSKNSDIFLVWRFRYICSLLIRIYFSCNDSDIYRIWWVRYMFCPRMKRHTAILLTIFRRRATLIVGLFCAKETLIIRATNFRERATHFAETYSDLTAKIVLRCGDWGHRQVSPGAFFPWKFSNFYFFKFGDLEMYSDVAAEIALCYGDWGHIQTTPPLFGGI